MRLRINGSSSSHTYKSEFYFLVFMELAVFTSARRDPFPPSRVPNTGLTPLSPCRHNPHLMEQRLSQFTRNISNCIFARNAKMILRVAPSCDARALFLACDHESPVRRFMTKRHTVVENLHSPLHPLWRRKTLILCTFFGQKCTRENTNIETESEGAGRPTSLRFSSA